MNETPIEDTPTKTVEKRNPDRTISTDRRAISNMRRIAVGFPPTQYYPVRSPSIESIARLLVTMAVSFPGLDIQMAKRDIAAEFRLLRLHPALSLLMCAELPGGFLGYSRDLVLIYLVMPFGRNGAPANFAIFGDAITCIRAKFGMGRPDWLLPTPFLSKLYVGDGLLSRSEMRYARVRTQLCGRILQSDYWAKTPLICQIWRMKENGIEPALCWVLILMPFR